MDDASLSAFENPSWHAVISDIIRKTSTNRTDVRDAVLNGLDLSFAKTILDLGCGFGFMTDAVAGRVARAAHVVGVDACAANEAPYLDRVGNTGRTVRFICQRIESQLDWPDDNFDLVLASYSLYFFANALPEVARVLAPHGMFLAVTHTESSCLDLLRAVGLQESDSRLLTIIHSFCAENAGRLLTPWFGEVGRVDYHNSLAFETAQQDDFLEYLRFKLPLLSLGSEPSEELPAPLARAARAVLSRQGRVVLEKDDAAFRCKRPRCP
ncbi:MAG: class I SAM-dependent methyltransferase [Phycisphaerae bacterium]